MNYPKQPHDGRRFITLDQHRCEQLLRTRNVGHVGLSLPDGPLILPVNYLLHDHGIVFRTEPHGILARLAHPQPAAFEVDELDHEAQTGWSVQLRGMSKAINEPAELVQLWASDPLTPWALGVRTLFIHIDGCQISGRQITATPVTLGSTR